MSKCKSKQQTKACEHREQLHRERLRGAARVAHSAAMPASCRWASSWLLPPWCAAKPSAVGCADRWRWEWALSAGGVLGRQVVAYEMTMFYQHKYGTQVIGAQLLMAVTISYVIKDRIKEWGKRFLTPFLQRRFSRSASADRRSLLRDSGGQPMGLLRESYRPALDAASISPHVLQVRWAERCATPDSPQRLGSALHRRAASHRRTAAAREWRKGAEAAGASGSAGEYVECYTREFDLSGAGGGGMPAWAASLSGAGDTAHARELRVYDMLRLSIAKARSRMEAPTTTRVVLNEEGAVTQVHCAHIYKFHIVARCLLYPAPSNPFVARVIHQFSWPHAPSAHFQGEPVSTGPGISACLRLWQTDFLWAQVRIRHTWRTGLPGSGAALAGTEVYERAEARSLHCPPRPTSPAARQCVLDSPEIRARVGSAALLGERVQVTADQNGIRKVEALGTIIMDSDDAHRLECGGSGLGVGDAFSSLAGAAAQTWARLQAVAHGGSAGYSAVHDPAAAAARRQTRAGEHRPHRGSKWERSAAADEPEDDEETGGHGDVSLMSSMHTMTRTANNTSPH